MMNWKVNGAEVETIKSHCTYMTDEKDCPLGIMNGLAINIYSITLPSIPTHFQPAPYLKSIPLPALCDGRYNSI